MAQGRLKNQPKYDRKPLHFGFSVGLNYYDFRVEEIAKLGTLPGYYNIRTETEPGYTLSIISNLRLGDLWDLRFNPGFASTVRRLHFDIIDPRTEERTSIEREIESSLLVFPLELKFKAKRLDNYRPYVIGGLRYALDLASDEKIQDDRVFKLKNDDWAYTVGFGVDIYFEYFKFSPQIVGIFGLNSLLVQDDTYFVEGIQTIKTRAILLNLTFE